MIDTCQTFLQTARYRSKMLIILISCNIALSSFYFGYLNNYFSCLNIHTMIQLFDIPLAPGTASGIINGIVPLSSIIGAAITYHFITKISRRKMIIWANCIAFLAGIILFIRNFYMLMLARFIQGICVGCYVTMSPIIIREIAPTEIAGILGAIPQIFMNFGIAFVSIFHYVLARIYNDQQNQIIWIYIFGFPLFTLGLQTVIFLFVFPYETPKYLISIGDIAGAHQLIKILYKEQYFLEIQMEKMEDLRSKKRHEEELAMLNKKLYGGTSLIVKLRSNVGRMALIVGAMQQLSGMNVVSLYGCDIAKDSIQSIRLLVPSIINTIQLFGAINSSYLLYRFGRKDLFVKGSLSLSMTMFSIFIGLSLQHYSNELGTFIILLGLSIFSIIFGMTLGPCTWLYLAEIADPQLMPYAVAMNRLSAFLSMALFPILSASLFNGDCSPLFIIFSIILLYYYFFCRRAIIQTKGKEEKQIRLELSQLKF